MINKKKQIVRVLIEALLAVLFAVLVEVGFNWHTLTDGYSPVAITENTTTAKGKLVYQKELAEPVYISKLILLGSVDKKSFYNIEMVTVNGFGKEVTLTLKDYMYPELDAAYTNINEKVKKIQITFKHPSNVHITSISYANEWKINKIRMGFFWLIGFLALLILLEKRLLLNQTWFIYMLAALGMGGIIIVTSGSYAVTWDEEVHYAMVHNSGFSSQVSMNSAIELNFARNGWTSINTAEEQHLMKKYLNEQAKKEQISYEMPKNLKNYITHFPMILSYHFGEKLGLSYTDNYALGRWGNLIFCVLLNVLAILFAKRKKILIAVIGMMPTVVFQSSTYTYDGVCFSSVTLGVVLCMNELEKKRGTEKTGNIIAAAVLLCAGSVAKPVYFPVIFLLVPCIWEKLKSFFNSRFKKRVGMGIVVAVVILSAVLVTIKVQPLLHSISAGDLNYGGDIRGGDTGIAGQILSIVEHPIAFGKMLIQDIFSFDNFRNASDEVENTTLVCNQMFLNLYILGTLKEVWALVLLPLLLLLFLVEPRGETPILYNQKTIRISSALATMAAVILVWLAMYLTFTPIGDSSIQGVQARYFLPLFLPFAYVIYNKKIQVNISKLHYYQIAMGAGLLLSGECIYQFLIVGKSL